MRSHFPACLLIALTAVSALSIATEIPRYRAGSLPKQEPQRIYSTDPHDPWNRVFFWLYTRTVQTRLTEDFKEEGPFVPTAAIGNPSFQATSRTFERIEDGDRAIDPLYPNLFSTKGSEPILIDPGFSELKKALQEACAETIPRAPVARALMQSDVWAAHEIVSWSRDTDGPMGDHARELLPLLQRFIGTLALNSQEIAALPHNYVAAQSRVTLPHVFDDRSGWIEVEWFPQRSHDEMGGNRHAARVFLKPPNIPKSFLDELNQRVRKHEDPLPGGIQSLDGAALLTEVLLIDRSGHVVPSPLISDLQLRTTTRDAQNHFKTSTVEEFELSRKLMLTDPVSGGFVHRTAEEPAYIPVSGNDFTFASPHMTGSEPQPPILGTLKRRCETCHFESAVFTFQMIPIPGRPTIPVRQLNPAADEHALQVADRKMKSRDFKALRLGR